MKVSEMSNTKTKTTTRIFSESKKYRLRKEEEKEAKQSILDYKKGRKNEVLQNK